MTDGVAAICRPAILDLQVIPPVRVDPLDVRSILGENPYLLRRDRKLVNVRDVHDPWKSMRDSTICDGIRKQSFLHGFDIFLIDRLPFRVVWRTLPHTCITRA